MAGDLLNAFVGFLTDSLFSTSGPDMLDEISIPILNSILSSETSNRHQNFSLALRRPQPQKNGIPTGQTQSTFQKTACSVILNKDKN